MRLFLETDLRTSIETVKFLIVFLVLSSLLGTSFVHCSEEYVYYGVIPDRIHHAEPREESGGVINMTAGFEINPDSVASYALISLVAAKDNTNVKVYTLEDDTWSSEAELNLNMMEKRFISLPNGTTFRIESNHLASVMLIGEGDPNISKGSGPIPATFYASMDGCYVGREFVFVASQWVFGSPYTILALGDAEVSVTREDDVRTSFKLQANTYKELRLEPFSAYRVESTGNIMIQSGGPGDQYTARRSFFVPTAKGGFLGEVFYSISTTDWDPTEDYGFRISTLEDAKVSIWDVQSKLKIQESEVEGGSGVIVKPKAHEIMMESDKPVTFSFVHNGSLEMTHGWGYGAGVTYLGLKPNEEALIYLPLKSRVEAYIFAYEDTLVKIDGIPMPIKADSFLLLTLPGNRRIIPDKNVVIQVIHWPLIPPIQGIASFGVVVPCIQTVDLVPDVELTSLEAGEGFPTTYVIVGVAAVIAMTASALVAMRRRAKRIRSV
ncbi:MAG: hypothetical protein OEY31_06635 [Candidatus Bathyarchaeota archaeon]|nr:hypothetical protein [Candidatus Bathyarchaeota archaeon]